MKEAERYCQAQGSMLTVMHPKLHLSPDSTEDEGAPMQVIVSAW